MSEGIVVLLGNKNDIKGDLSPTAKSRADKAVDILRANGSLKVITTGAFGSEFNNSNKPHGEWLNQYLIEKGIEKSKIMPFTHSSNTVEDAYEILRTLDNNPNLTRVIIITSKFHMERTEYIFSRVLQRYNPEFCEVPNQPEDNDLAEQCKTESQKFTRLKQEWVDVAGFDLRECPEKFYENLGYELRHYDSLSYYVIAGAFLSFGFLASTNIFSDSNFLKAVQYFISTFLIILLLLLYNRLTKTAGSARNIMNSIEAIYRKPGIHSTNTETKVFGIKYTIKGVVNGILLVMILTLYIKGLLTLLGIIS